MKVYKVDVEYTNEGETYGQDEFYLEALSDDEANDRGIALARESKYDDDRIPDRKIEVRAEEIEDHEVPAGAVFHRMEAAPKA